MENEGNAKHRSVIYPRCGNYRELARQLVFILTLSALVVPKPGCFDLIGRFLSLEQNFINFGARDAIFEAMQAMEKWHHVPQN